MNPMIAGSSTYTDLTDLAQLKHAAQNNSEESLRSVAKQFEGLFLQMMLKSMRDASFGDPIFDSHQSEIYRDLFDKQIALNMTAGKGIGLADALVRQLHRHVNVTNPNENTSATLGTNPGGAFVTQQSTYRPGQIQTPVTAVSFKSAEEFVETLWPLAESAARQLNLSPQVLVAQAALETGWGQAITQHPDGKSSYNLFNIKANNNWSGDTVSKQTLEYKNGLPVREKAVFRAYSSYAESFQDYVNFVNNNSRYADALKHTASSDVFVKKLHAAGYATDPAYADKILGIMKHNIILSHDNREMAELSDNV